MPPPRLLIGVPTFRGVPHIRKTLDSIAKQDHAEFRVLISVDGNDAETAAACAPILADPRFALVMQNDRLGWAGNLNWLMAQPYYDFFCYWQQDDVTSTDYIAGLIKSAAADPSAVCHFSDIQWTGAWTDKMVEPSVVGAAFDRAISIFERLNAIPLRGLIAKSAIERVGPIRHTPYESAFEEYVWVAKLARDGVLQRVEGPTYFKLAHDGSTHWKWHTKGRPWKRAVWLEFGLGMLETIWPVVPESGRMNALAVVLDRLCVPKQGRFLFYDGPAIPFAADFLSKARQRFSFPELERASAGRQAGAAWGCEAPGELIGQAIGWSNRRPAEAEQPTRFQFRFGDPGVDLLESGWSGAEAWGTWSDGPIAALRLPVGGRRGTWQAHITFQTIGQPATEVPMLVTVDSPSQTVAWRVPTNAIVHKELRIESTPADVTLTFAYPQAVSPSELGVSDDRRRLGVGLISLDLTEPAGPAG